MTGVHPHRFFVLLLFLSPQLTNDLTAQHQSVDHVTRDTFAALLFDVESFQKNQGAQYFPHEIVSAIGKRDYGIDPATIAAGKVLIAMGELKRNGPPTLGIILHLKKAVQISKTFSQGEPKRIEGISVYFDPNLNMHLVQPNSRTLILATTQFEAIQMAQAKNTNTPFTRLLTRTENDEDLKIIVSAEQLKPFLTELLDAVESTGPFPPPLAGINRFPDQLKTLKLSLKPQGLSLGMNLKIVGYDEEKARKIELTLKHLLALGKAVLISSFATELNPDNLVEKAQFDYMTRVINQIEKNLAPVRNGDTLTIQFDNDIALVGTLTALLLPAVQSARNAARRMQTANNLKQILLAFHHHHDIHKRFPAQAITDKEGKRLLSWRVQILPLLDQQALYDSFKLDEPWDSEHNLKLLKQIPSVYVNPNSADSHKTNYLAVTGKGTAFENQQGTRLRDFLDGTSNTVLIVEADQFVPWTQPVEFEVDWENPLRGLGNIRPGIIQAGLADGSVFSFEVGRFSNAKLKSFFTLSGQESSER
ncbi:MAG: DUF1559 domain-containing protein [Planctomycetota bacterium]|nr:DUF1559 domain-containing protein [Planctomycetota bacterium]